MYYKVKNNKMAISEEHLHRKLKNLQILFSFFPSIEYKLFKLN